MISPFLSPRLATQEASKAFTEIFSANFLPSFPKVDTQVLTNVLSPLLDQRDLDDNEIKAIVTDTYLKKNINEMINTGELPFYLNQKLMQIQEERHKREIEQLQAEKKNVEEQLQQSEQKHLDLTKNIKRREKYEKGLAGALIFLIVWALSYQFILLPTIKDALYAFLFAIIIALIFGYLLGFQRNEWILDKILKILGKTS